MAIIILVNCESKTTISIKKDFNYNIFITSTFNYVLESNNSIFKLNLGFTRQFLPLARFTSLVVHYTVVELDIGKFINSGRAELIVDLVMNEILGRKGMLTWE